MDPFKASPPQESKLHFLDYWRIIRIRKTIILAVFLLVVITATLVTFILPESFSATARIKVERDVTDIDPIEVIQSEIILGKVIDQLNLNHEWGLQYGSGENLKTAETMELLKRQLDLRPVRNTTLIEIICLRKSDLARNTNPNAPQGLAQILLLHGYDFPALNFSQDISIIFRLNIQV